MDWRLTLDQVVEDIPIIYSSDYYYVDCRFLHIFDMSDFAGLADEDVAL